jgi:uridine kinase
VNDSQLLDFVGQRQVSLQRPIVVGVSGYCGSGKSTLARRLTEMLPGAYRLRGDDFLDPTRSHLRSADWDGVDRSRLVSDVFLPVREGRQSTFQRYDWSQSRLGHPESLPDADIVVVDLIGLFHPEALPALDLTLWCDVDLETAAERGMARDAALGRDHTLLWQNVWIPNERDFDSLFTPRDHAEILVPTAR